MNQHSYIINRKDIARIPRALKTSYELVKHKKERLTDNVELLVNNDHADHFISSLPKDLAIIDNQPLFGQVSPQEPSTRAMRQVSLDDDFSLESLSEGSLLERPVSRPEGLKEIHERGFTGKGQTIVVIDSGLHPHKDFGDRIKHFKDFSPSPLTKAGDPFGHGTHVTGIIAGDGEEIDGIAPEADIIALRITTPLQAIEALDWAVENKEKFGIDVINMSLGVLQTRPVSPENDPFAQATQRAINAGIVTIAAAGNECKNGMCSGTINTPGYLPDVITGGSFDDKGTTDLSDDHMWAKSSNGPTRPDGIVKPDLVAPGVLVWGTASPGSALEKSRPHKDGYMLDTGSSMSTPMVSGAAALLLQANPNLNQHDIKHILKDTATPMKDVDSNAQGAGRLNLDRALRVAEASNILFA